MLTVTKCFNGTGPVHRQLCKILTIGITGNGVSGSHLLFNTQQGTAQNTGQNKIGIGISTCNTVFNPTRLMTATRNANSSSQTE